MDWKETHRRLVESLHGEVRGSWGRIAELETQLGLSDGYLNKLCSGRNEFRLSLFLEVLGTLGLDPKTFFARALDICPQPEDFLAQLEAPGEEDRAFVKIARATRELEATEPETPEPPSARRAAASATALVEHLATCPRQVQLRSLRHSAKYRSHAFTRAYLEHLDSLRYDDAAGAAKLVTGVATHLIPALSGPQSARLSLQCLALGVFGSARRLKGEFTSAVRALTMALELSRRARLREDTANLLIRASYQLKDFGHFEQALGLLNEALVIFVQLGSRQGIGKALVDHGMMRTALGDFDTAILDLEQALEHLEGSQLRRYQLAAYQFLAYAFEQLGNLTAAESCLAKGADTFGSIHAVDQAKLRWLRGTLAFRRGDFPLSERQLRSAGQVLSTKENPGQEALVSLDLVSTLLAQGKNEEAIQLARSMTRLLMSFKKNRLAEAAIVDLIHSALTGRLNEEVVRSARATLEMGFSLPRPASRAR